MAFCRILHRSWRRASSSHVFPSSILGCWSYTGKFAKKLVFGVSWSASSPKKNELKSEGAFPVGVALGKNAASFNLIETNTCSRQALIGYLEFQKMGSKVVCQHQNAGPKMRPFSDELGKYAYLESKPIQVFVSPTGSGSHLGSTASTWISLGLTSGSHFLTF